MASYTTTGTLYSGRYRFVQVDSGATAANVKTGTVGYLRTGSQVANVFVSSAGSSQNAGTYLIAAAGGYGANAIVQAVIGSGGTLTSVTLIQSGNGYVTAPVFTLQGVTGGVPGVIGVQMSTVPNQVTSYDIASTTGYGAVVRPVVFLNSVTPGNYGFIQELGVANVLGKASSFTGTAAIGVTLVPATGGVVDVPTATTTVLTTSIGTAIDLPVVSTLFKIYMTSPVVQD